LEIDELYMNAFACRTDLKTHRLMSKAVRSVRQTETDDGGTGSGKDFQTRWVLNSE